MRAQRYLHETGAEIEDLARVSVKAKTLGASNPNAGASSRVVSIDEVLDSRVVASPLTLLECCPKTDGAAAAVIAAPDVLRRDGVRILASALGAGRRTTGRRDMTRSEISELTAAQAYDRAGITASQIDVAELHDAFAIAELMYYESLGFAPIGQGYELARSGGTQIDGEVAVNPSGGLLARGHPVAATGLAQVAEIVWQLRGESGTRQRSGARYGLTHCTGGGIWGTDSGACSVHVFAS
jgi:acetyl-CoA acetyltransferase